MSRRRRGLDMLLLTYGPKVIGYILCGSRLSDNSGEDR